MKQLRISRKSKLFRIARWIISYRNRVMIFFLFFTVSINLFAFANPLEKYNIRYLAYMLSAIFLPYSIACGADERKEQSSNFAVVFAFLFHFGIGIFLTVFINYRCIILAILEEFIIIAIVFLSRCIIRSHPPKNN